MAELPVDRQALTRVVALINNKGGVGKTTITSNLAGLLAQSGWRVLAVDFDPQGNLALDLGYARSEINDSGRALAKAIQYPEHAPQPVSIRPNLDVLVGGPELSAIERVFGALSVGDSRRNALAQILTAVQAEHDYDIILIDCPPISDTLQKLPMAAARWMLIPVKTEAASLEGLKLTASRSDQVLDVNPDLDLLGVVIFATNKQATTLRREFIDDIVGIMLPPDAGEQERETVRGMVFDSMIRNTEVPANAARKRGELFHELEQSAKNEPKWWELRRSGKKAVTIPKSSSGVAGDFEELAQEFNARLAASEEKEASNV